MSRVKLPPGAERDVERILRERVKLDRRHLRRVLADAAAVAVAVRTILGRDPERPWSVQQHARVMRDIRRVGAEYGATLTARTRQGAADAARLGAEQQPRLMAAVASRALGVRVPAPRIDVPRILAAVGPTLDARVDGVGDRAGADVGAVGVARSFLAIRAAQPAAVVASQVSDAMLTRARDAGERVLVTEMTAGAGVGAQEARAALAQKHDTMKVVWDSTLDMRVCRTCASLHHQSVEMGKQFPAGVEEAPAHPRCRCATMPWLDRWTDMLDEMGIGPGGRTGVVGDVEIQLPSFGSAAPAEFIASRPG